MDEILDTAPSGFISFAADGTVLLVNRTLARWLAIDATRLQGQPLESILSVGGKIFLQTHLWPQLQLEGKIEEVFVSLRSSEGSTIPVLISAERHQRHGRTVFDCIFFRVTQREHFENELIRAHQRAEKADRAKAEFLSMMSHEFRTPLNAIIGFSEIIASEIHGPVTTEQRDDLSQIEKAGDDLLRILSDILTFIELDERGDLERKPAYPERVDLVAAVKRAVVLSIPQIEKSGVRFEQETSSETVEVRANAEHVRHIVASLLYNAIKFSAADGTVKLRISKRGNLAAVAISDSGSGISEARLPHIFEPFRWHSDSEPITLQPGLGLGLATCRKMARAMGGEITATSILGVGSVFTLTLPIF